MWRMRVVHTTGYRYKSPAAASYNEARLTPRSDSRQNVIVNRVETTPATRSYRYVDYWRTAVTAFDLHAPHLELEVTSSSVVETERAESPAANANWDDLESEAIADRYDEVLAPTPYTPSSKRIDRVGRHLAKGREPHEAVLLGDGRTLCVANGGILTHPDYDGVKLNIATMKPSLAYIDIETGDLVEKAELAPDLHRLSIRHLAMDAAGDVWFGCQYQGDPADRPPLVGRHRRGREIELFPGPQETLRAFRNYVGSVAVDGPGEVLATSSPHGGVIAFWDTATGRCLGTRELADGCGIAPLARNELLATSGRGAIVEAGAGSSSVVLPAGGDRPAWDNHLRRV